MTSSLTRQAAYASALVALLTAASFGQTPAAPRDDVRELKFKKTVERQIEASLRHDYRLALRAGQVLSVTLEETDVNLQLELVAAPEGKVLATTDLGSSFERETLTFESESGGEYLLRVSEAENESALGGYRLTARLSDAADEKTRTRARAERLLNEAAALNKEGTPDKIREAIAKREEALPLWRELGDRYWESHTLKKLGEAHSALPEPAKALEYLNRSLRIVRELGDRKVEAATLQWLGVVNATWGGRPKANEYYEQSLRLLRESDNRLGEAVLLYWLGENASKQGEKEKVKAPDYFNQSLALMRERRSNGGEAINLLQLGLLANAQNEKPKALDFFNQAMELWRSVPNKDGEAWALLNIGKVYVAQGDAAKALEHFDRALPLFKEAKNRWQEAATLNEMSGAYQKLGRRKEGIQALGTAVAFYRERRFRPVELALSSNMVTMYISEGDYKEAIRVGEATLATEEAVPEGTYESAKKDYERGMKQSKALAANAMAMAYYNTGENEKAILHHTRALEWFEKEDAKNLKSFTAGILNSIAQIHRDKFEWDKSLELYRRALALAKESDNKSQTAQMLNAIGITYASMGERRNQLESYQQALEIIRAIPDRGNMDKRFEASVLGNIGGTHMAVGETQTALKFYNEALAVQQTIKDPSFIDGQSDAYVRIADVYSYTGEKKQALELLARALELFRQAPPQVKGLARNRTSEAQLLNRIGVIHADLGENRRALEYYEQALNAAVNGNDVGLVSAVLNNIALINMRLGEPRKALQIYQKSLEIRLLLKNRSEMTVLNNIGGVYSDLGDRQEALKNYERALALAREAGNRDMEATALSNLGNEYLFAGANEKALEYFNTALAIRRKIDHKVGELASLGNIAIYYSNRGERGKAFELYEQALAMARAIGDKSNEAAILRSIAYDYTELGENRKALDNHEKGLALSRESGEKPGQMRALLGIGNVYRWMGERDKSPEHYRRALANYEDALRLSREIEDKASESFILLGIGRTRAELDDGRGAEEALTASLGLVRKYHVRFAEGIVHVALARLHERRGAPEKAADEYEQALLLARAVADNDTEAKAFKGLMLVWKARGNTALAIFYGKQAVNKFQELRGSIRGLTKESQDAYREKVTDAYRDLADLLIGAGRLPEAEQVLAMLKQQEAFEFIRRDAGEADVLSKNVGFSEAERKTLAEYARLAEDLLSKSRKLEELRRQGADEQSEEYVRLKREVEDGTEAALAFFKRLQSEFTKPTEGGGTFTAGDVDNLASDLRSAGPGVVLISTYLLPERYRAIVTTGHTMVDRKTEYGPLKLTGNEVNQLIMDFKQALQDPTADPRPLGKQLYDIFVRPLEKDLRGAGAKTLLWSLDGSLRYIPVGALYDGEKYLAERYQNVVITLGLGRMTALFEEPPRAGAHVLGLGVSKQFGEFSELRAVPLELRAIVRDERVAGESEGVLPGIRLLDSEFTVRNLIKSLRTEPGSNAFNVIHMATHFRLGSNRDDSALLLGDGQMLSLYTINRDSDIDFRNVALLTLSACETGVSVGDGGEVEGLGFIAQKKGAKAILATLWKVADCSTAAWMKEFYQRRKENPSMSKAEALRLTQQAMLDGALRPTAGECERRSKFVPTKAAPKGAPRFTPDPSRPFAHPYYWSPFILIGNWR